VKPKPASLPSAGKRQVVCSGPERIVSGGQTGADRAALDFAMANVIPHGGWCPQGRLAEDGAINAAYVVRETPASDPLQRTEWNVRDSDGTVILSIAGELCGGSRATEQFAQALGKPCLRLSEEHDGRKAAARLCEFLRQHGIRILNVAGPRASQEPRVGRFVRDVLSGAVRSK
jgi:hypothetical protein